MTRLVFQASIDPFSSYSLHLFALCRELRKLGFEPVIRVIRQSGQIPEDIQNCVVTGLQTEPMEILLAPLQGHAPTPGKKTLRMFSWESTRIPDKEVAMLNLCACCVVPSNFVATVASACGVNVPIVVVPLGVSDDFRYSPMPDGPFTFSCAGNPANGENRKGIRHIIDLFQSAFPSEQNVRLRMKAFGHAFVSSDERVRMDGRFVSEPEVAAWLADCHCFINFATGGWELWAHQAMACSRPVIGCAYGGMADYFNDSTGVVVAHHLVPAGDSWKGMGLWAEPDEASVTEAMRSVVKYQSELEGLGKHASLTVSKLTWENSAKRLAGVISGITGKATGFFDGKISEPERIILDHYSKAVPLKRPEATGEFIDYGLTERSHGLGDCLIMSPFPSAGKKVGRPTGIQSLRPDFLELAAMIPDFNGSGSGPLLRIDDIQYRWDCGNGHFIQRLHRALGFPVPILPKPSVTVFPAPSQRIAIHLVPGVHVNWQRKHVHPYAREIYPSSITALQQFIDAHTEIEFGEVGLEPSGLLKGCLNWTGTSLHALAEGLATCSFFIGIMSGPMHMATAVGCKCIVIVNFPEPNQIVLPCLKAIGVVEESWFYPQHVHLHQEGDGKLVKELSLDNLEKAMAGELYPFWSDKCLGLINEKL